MSWGAVAVGVATVASSVIGGNKAAKAEKKQLALQQAQLDFAKQRYNTAQTLYGGLQQQVVDDAMEGVDPDLQGVSDRAAADIAGQFRGAQQGLMRNNQRLGINPNSGQFQSQMRQQTLSEALAKAGGISRAREAERNNAEQQTFSRRYNVAQIGINQMNNTASNVGDSSAAMSRAYGQQASDLNAASGAALSNGLGMLAQGLSNYNNRGGGGGTGVTPGSLNIGSTSAGATGLSSYQQSADMSSLLSQG